MGVERCSSGHRHSDSVSRTVFTYTHGLARSASAALARCTRTASRATRAPPLSVSVSCTARYGLSRSGSTALASHAQCQAQARPHAWREGTVLRQCYTWSCTASRVARAPPLSRTRSSASHTDLHSLTLGVSAASRACPLHGLARSASAPPVHTRPCTASCAARAPPRSRTPQHGLARRASAPSMIHAPRPRAQR